MRAQPLKTWALAPLLLAGALLLSACSAPQDQPAASAGAPESGTGAQPARPAATSASSLAGTAWRLVEFQSMDDAQGVTRAADPSRYVMELQADGTAAMKLDCNRATGTWSAQPSAAGTSGSFSFGPLATTRALCPPPSLYEQIARQAPYVRSYLLKDGRLYLSLMADGGIYVWEPNTEDVAFAVSPDPEIEAAVRAAYPSYTTEIVDAGGGTKARYLYSRIDLNGDGEDEVFVYPLGSIFCGSGGCNLLLFMKREGGYGLVNEFPISRTPVIVTAKKSNGWADIWRLRSGGGAPANYIADRFDGIRYVDAEEIPAGVPPSGIRVLAGEFTFEQGFVLEPGG